ncbi:MAG: hypothetical protein M3530_09720 [Thermoproteota archaeon]|nr:hypothetical protein [Thermoproteota archaeon]
MINFKCDDPSKDEMIRQKQRKSHYDNEKSERMKDYTKINDQSELLKYIKLNCLNLSYSELAFP